MSHDDELRRRGALRRDLAELAKRHPELLRDGHGGRDEWERTLREALGDNEMAEPTKQVAFRLPIKLIERLDAYAEQMAVEHPGLTYTRVDAVKVLLTRGLNAAEAEAKRKRPTKRRPGGSK